MIRMRRTLSVRLTQIAAVGALAAAGLAAAGLAAVGATDSAASASPVTGKAAAATAPTWKMQAPPEPAGTTDQAFGAVSCSSSSACLAIAINDFPRGFGQFAETWNGSHWTVRTVPGGNSTDELQGVKCRSAQWCMAVGTKASGNDFVPVADRWNGSAWTPTKAPAPAGATNSDLGAVACSGTTACTAIGETAKGKAAPTLLAERWNGSAWKIQSVPAPTGGGGLLNAVACPAARACRAVGDDNKGLFSEVWNGSSWAIRPVPVPAGGSSAGLGSVSCTAANFCEAVGSYQKGGAFRWLAEVWNGSRWRAQTLPASGAAASQLNAVSCVSATDCEAAGDAGVAEGPQEAGVLQKWNGTKWSVQEKVLPAGDTSARLTGISCTTGPVCEAVGGHGKDVSASHLLALRYSS
jgi:hypothetical protein